MSSGEMGGQNLTQRGMGILVGLVAGAIAVGVFAIRGCQEGPFGRRQIVMMDPEEEIRLGTQAYNEVLGDPKTQVVRSGPIVDVVKEVTGRLVKATREPEFLKIVGLKERRYEWDVRVVNSREVNAFCLPGGKMVVFTGILPVCENDAALATVMGHELSHALGRHGAERMAQSQMANVGITAAGATMGGDMAQKRAVLSILNAGAKFGIMSYGRGHESEADHMGLFLMAFAGYDPEESVRFWGRMDKAAGGGGQRQPEFLSTHPHPATRINDLRKWMPDALKVYRASKDRSEARPLPLPKRRD
ncbi:MAG: M48 family metallopeptidase [Gemmataceae bacterium]|nr:M48 family metallopeptidase [Gemmataceae bacterium]